MQFGAPGVNVHDKTRATEGYTLYATTRCDTARLIDMDGNIVNSWALGKGGTNRCQLTPDGNLFIDEDSGKGPPKLFQGKCGMMREYDWDGNLLWEFRDDMQHHDVRILPNGNILYIAWHEIDDETAKRIKGGRPGTEIEGKMYGDVVKEVTRDGEVVWEWRLVDDDFEQFEICPLCIRGEYAHANTCSPLPNGDVMVSFRVLNMICIVDRETRKIKWHHQDLKLGHQHDCHMLESGQILMFANGYHSDEDTMWSRVIEIDPESHETTWQYFANPPTSFFSANISGAQRLWSGNTLICEGNRGCVFEVTPEGEVVWEYVNGDTVNHPVYGPINWIFRAYRYAPDAPELAGRI